MIDEEDIPEPEEEQPKDFILDAHANPEIAKLEDKSSGINIELHSITFDAKDLMQELLKARTKILKSKQNGHHVPLGVG